ncbi:rna-directed dna polymerase from mobile element jockey-like [Limosa lapponica baueri]|uniref:Rna-directed dna polymerase from mobile element jockey-like n=1 Tax=Limosa lapponica baueri TaxID=1758121 RepID=A0A2I0U8D5_LIMLA|nr:rna-directed dna polymerase from mobile element jockey-like [Limosa lapponica baueri]
MSRYIVYWVKNCEWQGLKGCSEQVYIRLETSGVPQRSILVPVQFNIFINDLDAGVECTIIKFADENKLGCAVHSLEGQEALQRDLERLEHWATINDIKYNKNKCWILHLEWSNAGHKHKLGKKCLESILAETDLGVLVHSTLNPLDDLCGPPLDSFQQIHVLPMLRTSELDAVLQVESHQSRVEGQNHLPQPAGRNSFDAAQDAVVWLGCQHTMLAHVELLVHRHPQVLLLRAALNPFCTQPVFVSGIAMSQVQDLALGLVELHEVHMGSLLKPVQVPLDGIPFFQRVDHATQLDIVSKLAEGALNPTVNVANKDVKQSQSQY